MNNLTQKVIDFHSSHSNFVAIIDDQFNNSSKGHLWVSGVAVLI